MSRMRVDAKNSIMGSGKGGSVFPEGVHVKKMKSAMGAGEIENYPDKDEMVHRGQDEAVSKAKARPMKPNYRN